MTGSLSLNSFKAGLVFFSGRGLNQGLQLVTGLLIVRWLPPGEYAWYILALAIMNMALVFVEMVFAGAIIPLVGSETDNDGRIGRLVAAAVRLRRMSFLAVAVVCLVLVPMVGASSDWPRSVIVLLTGAIIVGLYAQGVISIHSQVMFIRREIGKFYRAAIASSGFRLLALLVIWLGLGLDAATVFWLGTAAMALNAWMIFRESRPAFDTPPAVSTSETREIIHYSLPLVPGILFTALQGQILVFLASVFGDDQVIAEVGAVTRLALLFAFFADLNKQLVAPWIAKQPNYGFRGVYFRTAATGLLATLLLFLLGYLFRQPLLWLIGDNYRTLDREVVLLLAMASLAFLNNLLWTVNASRRWVFWWMPMLSIPGTIGLWAIMIAWQGANDAYTILLLGVATELFNLAMRLLVSGVGLLRTEAEPVR